MKKNSKNKRKKKINNLNNFFKLSQKKNKPKRIFLKSLRISNFKAFNGENKIELAPMINLIFGKNSSGKSTVLQALRLFRQSYGPGKLTPFNYEAPQQYVGNGGLNIDVGYSGIVNDGSLSKNISLGVETGLYDRQKKEVLKDSNLLQYYYQYKPKFYTGKNLVKDKTILKKIKFSNLLGENTIELPSAKFFKENTEFAEQLQFRENVQSGAFFLSRREKKNEDNIYQSSYNPYYYKTLFKPKNFIIKSISHAYDQLQLVNIKNLIKYFENFENYLIDIQKEKKDNKNTSGIEPGKYSKHRNRIRDFQKKVLEIRNKKISLDNQLNEFNKIKGEVFATHEDDMIDFIDSPKELYESRKELINDVKKIITFLKNNKNISKNTFNKFFLDEICNKHKDIVFYNGQFVKNPNIKNKNKSRFIDNLYSHLLINNFSWPLCSGQSQLNKINSVNIIETYNVGRFGTSMMGGSSILDNVSKAMNKCQVVPSYRLLPRRYFVKGLQTNYVGPGAENLGELLSNVKIKNATNKWFKKLEIPYQVSVQKSGNYYVILFKPRNSNIKISSMHVGLGYSVVLPFIVQCIISKNKIITIEEPEVHLHPKLEADFAELIIESSLVRENQFILETHSEEFLLRILKSIRKKILKVEDVSINYISQNKKHKNHITKIKVNKYGQYETPWKDDLFADRILELN